MREWRIGYEIGRPGYREGNARETMNRVLELIGVHRLALGLPSFLLRISLDQQALFLLRQGQREDLQDGALVDRGVVGTVNHLGAPAAEEEVAGVVEAAIARGEILLFDERLGIEEDDILGFVGGAHFK